MKAALTFFSFLIFIKSKARKTKNELSFLNKICLHQNPKHLKRKRERNYGNEMKMERLHLKLVLLPPWLALALNLQPRHGRHSNKFFGHLGNPCGDKQRRISLSLCSKTERRGLKHLRNLQCQRRKGHSMKTKPSVSHIQSA